MIRRASGFTLIEVAFVLLIVAILLGYTVALFPRQQELKQYRAVQDDLDRISVAIVGFAQVNGRLPCPSDPDSNGLEVGGGAVNCGSYAGFVPVNTLGLDGDLNGDMLLLDPWNNPYRYYVSATDADDTDGDSVVGDGVDDFVRGGEMRDVGLVDNVDFLNGVVPGTDGYLDLDGQYVICASTDATPTNDICDAPVVEVFGEANAGGPWAGAPFVLVSNGKNWSEAAAGDELVNMGASQSNTDLGLGVGPTGNEYLLKNVGAGETTFVRRVTGLADDFDDIVRWVSPNLLYSKMIDAGQLP